MASRHRLRLVDASTGDLYLDRWGVVLAGGRCNVMLHHIGGTDEREPHDHPWNFVTIALRGGYDESWFPDLASVAGPGTVRRHRRFRPRRVSRGEYHAVTAIEGDVWTLVFAGRRRHDWGFALRGDHDGDAVRHVHFTDPEREPAHLVTIEWGSDG
ncbi:MAG: hypothetical protein R2707_15370 [Acidimicrobiales bacterium]